MSWRSSTIWSAGVVVVRPQPGQAKSAHCTQLDIVVLRSPTAALYEPMPVAPFDAYQSEVAASLSLSSIISWATGRSAAGRP
jgi:hypothetical protein